MALYKCPRGDSLKIVTWADGSDAEIAAMLDAHYAGKIDIHDYWHAGDERQISLSAMSATGVSESHVAQTITMVLVEGGIANRDSWLNFIIHPITGREVRCAFVVMQKDLLNNNGTMEGGAMNEDSTYLSNGWTDCTRRTWCNEVYRMALPSTIRGIFKQHKNKSSKYGGVNTNWDYFAIPSVLETTTYNSSNAPNAFYRQETQNNSSNEDDVYYHWYYYTYQGGSHSQFKKAGGTSNQLYWTRSVEVDSASTPMFMYMRSSYPSSYSLHGYTYGDQTRSYGIAPYGCI